MNSKIKLDSLFNRKEYSGDFFNDITEKGHSFYEPNVDAVVVTPHKVRNQEIATKWVEWYFMDTCKAIKEINGDLKLLDDYLVFQHEINSHRIPLVYSTLGSYIAFLQYRLNCMFMDTLRKRRKIDQSIFLYEHGCLFDVKRYTRIVLESLATFREMLVLSEYFKFEKIKNGLSMANTLQLQRLRNKKVYLKGYTYALKISELLGEKGVLAAAIYALNPRLSVKKYGVKKHLNELFTYTDLRYGRILDLRKEDIPRKLDKNCLRSILRFFMEKFRWEDPYESRISFVSSLEINHPYILREMYPSSDFYSKPSGRKGGILPTLIFYRHPDAQKKEVLMSKGHGFSNYWMNFIVTMAQHYGQRILLSERFFTESCPLRNFYNNSCEVCRFYSHNHNCEIILKFYSQYDIRVAE